MMKKGRKQKIIVLCFLLCLLLLFLGFNRYYYMDDNKTVPPISLGDEAKCQISLSSRKKTISLGEDEQAQIIIQLAGNCSDKTINISVDGGEADYSQIVADSNQKTFYVHPTKYACQYTMGVYAFINGEGSAYVSLIVKSPWQENNGCVKYDSGSSFCMNKSCADQNGYDFYVDSASRNISTKCFTHYYYRGCFDPSVNQPSSACFCNAASLENATSCRYQEEEADSIHRFKIDGVSAEKCKPVETPVSSLCINNNIKPQNDNINTNICEGDTNTQEISDEICDDENKYYRIETNSRFNVKYDMNKDGITSSTLNLKSGESFTFDVLVTSKKQLKGTFNSTVWINDYEKIEDEYNLLKNEIGADFGAKKISDAKNSSSSNLSDLRDKSARMYELDNLMDDMEKIVEYYNNHYVNITKFDEKKPTVSLKFDYTSKGKPYTSLTLLEPVTASYVTTTTPISNGSIAYSKTSTLYKKTARGTVVNTWDFDYNNYSNPSVWKFAPPEMELDGTSGEVKGTSAKSIISGGRRIYTEKKNVDGSTYKVTVRIDELEIGRKGFTIINEQCSLNVKKTHLNYRVIDVTDKTPEYITGINWVNPTYGYNFKDVIRADIWKSPGRNAITNGLSGDEIREIQRSNSRLGPDAYLGTCDITGKQDSVSKYLCE